MTEEIITCDTIINWLKEQYGHKEVVPPDMFIDAAEKLNILVSDEIAKHAELFQRVAKEKVFWIEDKGLSVARAKAKVEATDSYKELKIQEAKIELITEHIRLAKLHARMVTDEIRNYS